MIANLELELDTALARLVDLEDRLDYLERDNAEKDDALGVLLTAFEQTRTEAESLQHRNAELEAMLASRPAS